MFNTRKQLSKHVDKKVKKILSILPHKNQRNLKSFAVARIYHKIQDYPKVIKYLNLFIQARNVAVAHKLLAHAYRLLKIPDVQSALVHYQRCIQINPHQTSVIKEVCQMLLNENSIFSIECANYWLDLAASKNLNDNEAVSLLRVRLSFIKSFENSSSGMLRLDQMEESVGDFLKTQLNSTAAEFLNENSSEYIETMKIIVAAADKLNQCGPGDLVLFETPEFAVEFRLASEQERSLMSKKEQEKKSKQAAETPGPSSLQGQTAKKPKSSIAKKPELVEEVITDESKEMPLEHIALLQSNKEQELKSKQAAETPGPSSLQGHKARQPGSSIAKNPKLVKEAITKENEKDITDESKEMPLEHIALLLSNKEQGPKSMQAEETPAPSSLQGQKAKQPVSSIAKKSELVEEVITKKNKEVITDENKEMPLEHIAKRNTSKKEQEKPAGLDHGNALNPSTSSSSGKSKSKFGLAPAANSATGVFSFGALNTSASDSADQMTRNSNIGETGSSPFKFTAPTVVAPSASLRSKGRLSCSIPKPTRQHQKVDLKLEEMLFVNHAKLYRHTNGEWEIRGQGDIKILRHIKSKELRVIMRQEQVLNLCLYHMLNTDVVYKPMDKKSWVFAAHDFSEGKGALERFALRFKNQKVAQEFNSAVKNALNGTAEAVKNNKDIGQRGTKEE